MAEVILQECKCSDCTRKESCDNHNKYGIETGLPGCFHPITCKVNILGTDYDVIVQTEQENPKLEEANGICEIYAKKIVLLDIKPDKDSFDNLDAFKRRILRHEIIHAFFAESGLRTNSNYAQDEELIDWIAIQFYKMAKAFKDAGCEEE